MPEQTKERWRRDADGKPYAVCPKCHAQIRYLEVVEQAYITYLVSPDTDDTLKYEDVYRQTPWDWDYNYTCPECDEVIATSDAEAEALFIGPSQEQEAAQEQGVSPASNSKVST